MKPNINDDDAEATAKAFSKWTGWDRVKSAEYTDTGVFMIVETNYCALTDGPMEGQIEMPYEYITDPEKRKSLDQ